MSIDATSVLSRGRPEAASLESCVMVLFGASGDLTKRKLIPALYNLTLEHRLPRRFSVVGYARSEMTHETFRKKMRAAVSEFSRTGLKDESVWNHFAANLHYVRGGYEEAEGYRRLRDFLTKLDRGDSSRPNLIFYLAMPPDLYTPVIRQIAGAGLVSNGDSQRNWRRIVIEKPFGSDLKTAQELNRQVHEVFDESQVYRIDHYLGKETVQNILVFRFGNSVFEPIWNRRYVDHVQITAAETVGVEDRGGYYEEAGVIRDMFQNHLLQLLCLTAMEPPVAFSGDAVHDEKVKVLRSVRPISSEAASLFLVRGQYGRGTVNGKEVEAYQEEPDVAGDSRTETYAALKLFIDNWRWEGVPFYLRSGKRLAKRVTEVAIHFKRPPLLLFQACALGQPSPNVLVLRIQPDEGISLTFEVKSPGPDICVNSLSLDFSYQTAFGGGSPDAYETLLLDCMEGDSTLFTRHDWVELAWSLMTPLLQGKDDQMEIATHKAGTWGPEAADRFIGEDGRRWRCP